LIEGGSYTVAQATANTDAAVKTWLASQINALPGMAATGITVAESDITIGSFTAATAGVVGNSGGTNGSFPFTVTLNKGGGTTQTTTSKTGTITATPLSDADAVAADKAALTWSVIQGANTAETNVTANLATLPTSGASGTTISWSSTNTSVVSNTGAVTRPAYGSGDATVTLTATITKGTASNTVVFTLTVKELPCTHDAGARDNGYCSNPLLCTICGVQIGAAIAHTPGAAATCTTPQTCTVCGYEIAAINPTAHDWGAWTVTTPATCSAPGEETRICNRNGDHKETRSVPVNPTAHDWGAWTVTTPATVTGAGEETRICNHNGNHRETREIPKLTSTVITGITVDGQAADRTDNNFNILSRCGANSVETGVAAIDPAATVTVNGIAQNPRTVNLPIYGDNTITVVVTAQNGDTETYTLTVHKPVPADVAFFDRFAGVLTVPVEMAGIGAVNTVEWYRNGVRLDRDPLKGYIETKEAGNYHAVINGKIRTCEVTRQQATAAKITARPNPTYGEVNVECEQETVKIQVFDHFGRLVLTPTQKSFNIGHLPAGIYVVRINGETVKVIKQ
jgi:hypothetical protein